MHYRTIRPPDRAAAAGNDAAPVGPFSLGVRGVGLLFLSGQVAQDPATGKLIDGDVDRVRGGG
jgi:enamine deaminase RidA (YjgF/YER057c/UK114 family)